MSETERLWPARLRWRLMGATQWPAFALATALDAVILHLLPPLSVTDVNLIEAALVATFGNLVLAGAAAPFLTRRLLRRARHEDLSPETRATERLLMRDRVTTGLLAAGVAATLVSGIANRPTVVSETEATEEVGRQLRIYVQRSGSEELSRNLEAANTHRLGEDYFRACVPRDDRRRHLCLLIDTAADPTAVKRDPNTAPNSALFGD